MRTIIVIAAIAACAAGGLIWYLIGPPAQTRAVVALAEEVKARLAYVPGGNFTAGDFEFQFVGSDGVVEARWATGQPEAFLPYEVTLDGFYLDSLEVSMAELNVYRRAEGLPPIESEGRARADWVTADGFCAWLGEVTALPMRLPREAEWEWAARPGGVKVLWPTDDGTLKPGENIQEKGIDAKKVGRGGMPPNPRSIFDMTAGVYEWVADRADSDPAEARIAKGSSDASSTQFELIPDRYIVEPTTVEAAKLLLDLEQKHEGAVPVRMLPDGRALTPTAGVRCLAEVTAPPSESGIGFHRDASGFEPPEAYREGGKATTLP